MKLRILSFILALATVVPFAACGARPERAPEALSTAELMSLATGNEAGYMSAITGDKAKDKEIWSHAEAMYQEFKKNQAAALAMPTRTINEIVEDPSEFTYPLTIKMWNQPANWSIRTFDALKDFKPIENMEYTEYGGWKNESMKQEATGHFYTKKIGNRWWLITPEGYPTIMRGIQGIMPFYSENQDQLKSTLAKWGSTEKWAIGIAFEVKALLGVHTTNFEGKELLEVPEQGFSFGTLSVPMITGYGNELGIAWSAGSTYFDANMDYIKKNDAKSEATQVMPIFDRAFVEFADRQAKEKLEPYANDPRIVVINTDNEIPIKVDTLERYLKYSSPEWLEQKYPGNEKNALYHETYAVTLTWMRFMTGKDNVTAKDITSELSYLFLGFLYDRLMKVSSEAIKKYDQNHVYCGNRSLSGGEGAAGPDASNSVLDREWVVRFSAQYLDAYALNWYSRWNPSADECRRMTQWTNDLPIFITEFGCKTDEGTGRPADPGYANNGGGFYVFTQEERAAWYESITLDFLEWGNIVGWNFYRYNNYSTGTDQVLRSSGGVINDFGVYDPKLSASMAKINKNTYSIIKFLDERQDNWDKYFN